MLGEFERLLNVLQDSERLGEAVRDERRLGRVSGYLAHVLTVMGNHQRAVEAGQRALALADAAQDLTGRVVANHYQGLAGFQLGKYGWAAELLRRNVADIPAELIYERFGLAGFPSVFCRTFLAMCFAELGQFAEGLIWVEEALRLARAAQQPYSETYASWAAWLYTRRGDLNTAIPILERGMAACEGTTSIRGLLPFTALFLGPAYTLDGRLPDAISLLEGARGAYDSMAIEIFRARAECTLGEAYQRAGRAEEAFRLAQCALDRSRRHGERGDEAWTLRLLGEIYSQGNPLRVANAEDWYRQALVLADELGMRPLVAHCDLGLGKLYRHTANTIRPISI